MIDYYLAAAPSGDITLDLKEGDQRIRLRKGSAFTLPFGPPPHYPAGPQPAPRHPGLGES